MLSCDYLLAMNLPALTTIFTAIFLFRWIGFTAPANSATTTNRFQLQDMFELEFASDPQISPDGTRVVFVRHSSDIMKDKNRSCIWIVNRDGSDLRPLTTGDNNDSSPVWSPDGTRLLYTSTQGGSTQVYVRWMDSGQTGRITRLETSPSDMAWSPDGRWIAFSMHVPTEEKPFAELPRKPEGADWAKPAKVVRKLIYRTDEEGYLKPGYSQLFVMSAEGGTPHQLTSGEFDHKGPLSWTPDGKILIFSANRHDDADYQPLNTEIYEVTVETGHIKALTQRDGPDESPALSPDGKQIAYVGFDDHRQGYQVKRLYVMNRDGTGSHAIANSLDREVERPVWSKDGSGIYFQYDDRGNTRIAYASLNGNIETVAKDLGGVSPSRPYASGSFTTSRNGHLAYTQSRPDYPADIAVGTMGSAEVKRITRVNEGLMRFRELGAVENMTCESSFDKRPIEGWIVKPPAFDSTKKYPLILEIHGGPFANYGDRFASEFQLYAAAGYMVLYTNPRGSTSYGEQFGNLIHHNYPGQDYDDLMSAVNAVISRGSVDTNNMFVTGGSGGGVLTAWIVGKTDRFRAAVSAKPVINWYSFVLTSDGPGLFYQYWFPGYPWEQAEHYLKRSPISLVGNVKTPTMLLTGESDFRTPISESEQFYEALKLRKVDAMLVRLPEATHGMAERPSFLVSKIAHILKWFEIHRTDAKK